MLSHLKLIVHIFMCLYFLLKLHVTNKVLVLVQYLTGFFIGDPCGL